MVLVVMSSGQLFRVVRADSEYFFNQESQKPVVKYILRIQWMSLNWYAHNWYILRFCAGYPVQNDVFRFFPVEPGIFRAVLVEKPDFPGSPGKQICERFQAVTLVPVVREKRAPFLVLRQILEKIRLR